MKARYLPVLVLCIVTLLVSVACSGGGKAPNGMTAAEIMAMSEAATIDTVCFSATGEAGVMGENLEVTMVGAADVVNEAMYIVTSPDMADYTMQIYIVDDWFYISGTDVGTGWIKTELTGDILKERDFAASHMELLVDIIEAKYLGMENIGGFNCFKIEIVPNWDAIFSAMGLEGTEGFTTEDITDMIKDTQCIAWISEGTYYPIQIFFSYTIDIPFFGEYISDTTLNFFDINQPVTIILPAGAQNATEISYDDYKESDW